VQAIAWNLSITLKHQETWQTPLSTKNSNQF
jgi:hypothetical protein